MVLNYILVGCPCCSFHASGLHNLLKAKTLWRHGIVSRVYRSGTHVGVPNQSSFLLFTLSFVTRDLPNYLPRTVNDRLSAAAVKRYFANTQISTAALIRVAALNRSFTISKNIIFRFKSAETKYFAPPNRHLVSPLEEQQKNQARSFFIKLHHTLLFEYSCRICLLAFFIVCIYISYSVNSAYLFAQGLFFTRPC